MGIYFTICKNCGTYVGSDITDHGCNQLTGLYFEATDGDDESTVWASNPEFPERPTAVMRERDVTAGYWPDVVARMTGTTVVADDDAVERAVESLRDLWHSNTQPLMELTYEQRKALPAKYHQPHWDGLGVPHNWMCSVCWDDGLTHAWPCDVALTGNNGLEIARHGGLSYSW